MEQGILGSMAKYEELAYNKVLMEGFTWGLFEAAARAGSKQNDEASIRQLRKLLNARYNDQRINISVPIISEENIHQFEDGFQDRLLQIRDGERNQSLAQYLCLGHTVGVFRGRSPNTLVEQSIRRINLVFPGVKVDEERLFKLIKGLPIDKEIADMIWALKCQLQKCHEVIRILFLSAVPDSEGLDRIRPEKEHRKIRKSIEQSKYSHGFEVVDCHACTLDDIAAQLREHKPTILHFSGHGGSQGLCLETDDGDLETVATTQLVGVLRLAAEYGLRTVILNACATDDQSVCIAQTVGRVIAMKGDITDRAAIKFTEQFYDSLVQYSDVDEAFNWSLEASQMPSDPEIRPVLIVAGQSTDSPVTHPPIGLLQSAHANKDTASDKIASSAEWPSSNKKHLPSKPVEPIAERDCELVSPKVKQSMKVDALSMLEQLKRVSAQPTPKTDQNTLPGKSGLTDNLSMIERLKLSNKTAEKPSVAASKPIPIRGGPRAPPGSAESQRTVHSMPTPHNTKPSRVTASFEGANTVAGHATHPKFPAKPSLFCQHPFFDDPFFQDSLGGALFDDIMMSGLFGPPRPSSRKHSDPAPPSISRVNPAPRPPVTRGAASQSATQAQNPTRQRTQVIIPCDLCNKALTEDGGLICGDCNQSSKIACIRCIPELPCIQQKHNFAIVKIDC